MAKWLAITFGLLLVVTNGAWVYAAIDLAVTEKYRQQIQYENENKLMAYEGLARHFLDGMSKSEVMVVLKARLPEEKPFEKEGCLVAGWVQLPMANDGRVKQGRCEY